MLGVRRCRECRRHPVRVLILPPLRVTAGYVDTAGAAHYLSPVPCRPCRAAVCTVLYFRECRPQSNQSCAVYN